MILARWKIIAIASIASVSMIAMFATTLTSLVGQTSPPQTLCISNPGYKFHGSTVESHDILYFSRSKISEYKSLTWGNPMVVDFNNDGCLDVVIASHLDPPQFYVNGRGPTFTNIFNSTGIIQKPFEGKGDTFSKMGYNDRHGFAWGDYNNDDIMDLYITMGACEGVCFEEKQDYLYQGLGDGTFRDVTNATGTTNAHGRGRSASWVDYNNDGFLDLFVLNMKSNSVLYHNNGDGTFTDVAAKAGLQEVSGEISSWADYNNDSFVDLLVTGTKVKVRLFHNNGDATFDDVTAESGLKPLKNSRGVAWGDYNNDGYLDLFITRGFKEYGDWITTQSGEISFRSELYNDQVHTIEFKSDGAVTFDLRMHRQDSAFVKEHVFIGASMTNPSSIRFTLDDVEGVPTPPYGTNFGYFIWKNTDGVWHLRLSHKDVDSSSFNWYGRITTDGSFTNLDSSMNSFERYANNLYRNDGHGTFVDVTDQANLYHMGNHYSAVWGDYDNDGWLDLYVVESGDISGGKPNLLYHNNADGTFMEVAGKVRLSDYDENERHGTAAWGDLDNDGFLDLVVKDGIRDRIPLSDGSVIVYRNNGNAHHWLEINLVGERSNKLGLGAYVKVEVGGLTFYQQLNGAGGGDYMSQGYGPLHFGLGHNTNVDSISIDWPSGIRQKLTDVPIDRLVTIRETA